MHLFAFFFRPVFHKRQVKLLKNFLKRQWDIVSVFAPFRQHGVGEIFRTVFRALESSVAVEHRHYGAMWEPVETAKDFVSVFHLVVASSAGRGKRSRVGDYARWFSCIFRRWRLKRARRKSCAIPKYSSVVIIGVVVFGVGHRRVVVLLALIGRFGNGLRPNARSNLFFVNIDAFPQLFFYFREIGSVFWFSIPHFRHEFSEFALKRSFYFVAITITIAITITPIRRRRRRRFSFTIERFDGSQIFNHDRFRQISVVITQIHARVRQCHVPLSIGVRFNSRGDFVERNSRGIHVAGVRRDDSHQHFRRYVS